MTSLAKVNPPAFFESDELRTPVKPSVPRKRARGLSREDQQVVIALGMLRRDLENLHNRYDQTTDPLLVDSLIYELKSVNIKYKYYLHLCKEKGIVGGGPVWTGQP